MLQLQTKLQTLKAISQTLEICFEKILQSLYLGHTSENTFESKDYFS